MLSNPLRHHERLVMTVFAAPTPNSTSTVAQAEKSTPPCAGATNRYGTTGTAAPNRYDRPTVNAERNGGSNDSTAKPSSSRIITFDHLSGSAVICATIFSSNSPEKPLAR